MTKIDTRPEVIARVTTALRDWEQYDEGVNNDAREEAADMLESLTARVAELEAQGMADNLNWEKTSLMLSATLDRAKAAEAEVARLREALTPSSGTKAAYSGEFSIRVYEGEDEERREYWRQVPVDWTTIKAIMAKINARAGKVQP